jgi:hypothetical protein
MNVHYLLNPNLRYVAITLCVNHMSMTVLHKESLHVFIVSIQCYVKSTLKGSEEISTRDCLVTKMTKASIRCANVITLDSCRKYLT